MCRTETKQVVGCTGTTTYQPYDYTIPIDGLVHIEDRRKSLT